MIFFNIFTIQKYGGANFTFKKAKDQHMTIMTIIWTNLVDLESPMLFTKIQPQSFLGSGEEDF